MVPFAGLFLIKSSEGGGAPKYVTDLAFWMYVLVHMVATTYSYIWDIKMDWGLMTCFDKGKWGLRE